MIILHEIKYANRAHATKSQWTKGSILLELNYYYGEFFDKWKLEDLRTLLIKDGYQTYGDEKGKHLGHAALYCLDLAHCDKIVHKEENE